jgi:hypothetical protein
MSISVPISVEQRVIIWWFSAATYSLVCVVSESDLQALLTEVPNLMYSFRCLATSKGSVEIRGSL